MSLIKEKRGFNTVSNTDSIWNRSAARRVVRKDKGGPNDQQASGADIAKKMDFDIEPARSIYNSEPLSFMDVIFDVWGVRDEEEEEDDDKPK